MSVNSIPVVYVAGKFRGPKLADVDRNIAFASMFVAPIAEAGAMPVTVHLCEGVRAHDIHQENNGQWWIDATLAVLQKCEALVAIPGWQTSSGTLGEIQDALKRGIPVFSACWAECIDLDTLPVPAPVREWVRVAAVGRDLDDEPYFQWDPMGDTFASWMDGVERNA